MEREVEPPDELKDLEPEVLEKVEIAYKLGFDAGVDRGIYETLKSFYADFITDTGEDNSPDFGSWKVE